MKNVKRIKILRITTIALWAIYTIAIFLDADILYNIFSPLTALSAALLIWQSLPNMGRFWRTGQFFMFGILAWFVSDLILFVHTYIIIDHPLLILLSDNLYLMPDYLFAVGLVIYIYKEFKRTNFNRLLVNIFIISVIGFIFAQRLMEFRNTASSRIEPETISTMLYFFIVLFTLSTLVTLCTQSGFKRHTRAAYLIAAALAVYNLFEMRYTYYMTIDKEPESIYIDIIYLLGLVIYAIAFSFPDIATHQSTEVKKNDISKTKRYIVWINSLIIMGAAILLNLLHIITMTEVYYLLTTTLAYIIMYKTIQANELNERLLEQQKNETARLEELVAAKTKELKEMNDYLEKISNTDALTGLPNRRYGLQTIHELVKMSEKQPFALFSLDLNYFKPINDNYGHDMGDYVLKEVGNRLLSIPSDQAKAFRIGGDEFMVILCPVTDTADIHHTADYICSSLDAPIECSPHTFHISTSIGIAVYPEDSDDIDAIFRFADEAMYSVKHTSRQSTYRLYSADA